jgi:hypothetical protein
MKYPFFSTRCGHNGEGHPLTSSDASVDLLHDEKESRPERTDSEEQCRDEETREEEALAKAAEP